MSAAPRLTPVALRCDHQVAPLALSGAAPSFSWELVAPPGEARQTAYRVTVASSPAALDPEAGAPDLWDSGFVSSSASFGVAYRGATLGPRRRCWWRVAVRDATGAEAHSEPAAFETGQLDAHWDAVWIAAPRAHSVAGLTGLPPDSERGLEGCHWAWPAGDPAGERDALLEAEFTTEGEGAGVVIAVLGPFTLSLNGRVVDTGTYWRTAYFVDLGPYLRRGRNRLTLAAERTYVGPAGVVGRLFLQGAAGSAQVATDLADLWHGAATLGEYGELPWGRLRPVAPPTAPPLLRREFSLAAGVVGLPARLYASALGLYRARINGAPVADARLAPGWTDYAQRALYQAYRVDDLLVSGENVIEVELADGWYAGNVACVGRSVYGERPAFICELRYALGSEREGVVASDALWTVAPTRRRAADLLKGEWHDLRVAAQELRSGGPVEIVSGPRLVAQCAPQVGVTGEHPARSVTRLPAAPEGCERHLVDFGRNLSGVVRLRLPPEVDAGSDARTIALRHAEMLDERGELYTASLRGATQLDAVTLPAGAPDAPAVFEPAFTVHGFRYLEVSGYGAELRLQDANALEIGSRLTKTGELVTSDERLNELVRAIERTLRSNYGALPTDCPNRDERMGWLDVHATAPSAMHLFDLAAYYRDWLASLREAQYPDGVLPHVVPDVLAGGGGEAGWADCAVILPWLHYQRYGDERVLRENYAMMRAWVDYLAREGARSGTGSDLVRPAEGFGDWLAAGEDTPKDLIGTAYFARSTRLLARTAATLGESEAAARYAALGEAVTAAFNRHFVASDGVVGCGSQTGYVLALDFDLLPAARRQAAADALAANIRQRGGLATGYMGVPRLLNTLSRFGYEDLALALVGSRAYPGWLHMLEQGATTLWERWDSYRPGVGFADPAMNSFNHPSLCAVLDWLVSDLGGLEGAAPGFAVARFRPPRFVGRGAPDGALVAELPTRCEVVYRSQVGEYSAAWEVVGDELRVEAAVPANGALEVALPAGVTLLGHGRHRLTAPVKEAT